MLLPTSLEQKIRHLQPLIIIGMHRSGTSLTVQLLSDVGIHMGRWLSRDAESIYFQRMNRKIFAKVGVNWGHIEPLMSVMQNDQFVEEQTEYVLDKMFTDGGYFWKQPGIADFFGTDRWAALCQGEMIWWGWKDPRTTITFPIWLRAFPRAKVLHVVRNGIDVAISTHRRSKKQQKNLAKRLMRLDYIPETLDFQYCFQLWESYVSFFLDHRDLISDECYFEMRYEDLLSNPLGWLRKIANFVGIPVPDSEMIRSCSRVDIGRLDNSKNAEEYKKEIPRLVNSPMMRRLGYTYPMMN